MKRGSRPRRPRHRSLALVALAGGVVAMGCAHYAGGASPIAPEVVAIEPGWMLAAPTPTVLQRGLSDCGAAALAMVAGRWAVPLTLAEATRELPPGTAAGVRLGDLRDLARAHGLDAFALRGDPAMLAHELGAGRPVIVGLLRPYDEGSLVSHFEVVVALRPSDGGDELVTIDPASGWLLRRWSQLDAEWAPAGRPALVVIGPAAPAPRLEAGARPSP